MILVGDVGGTHTRLALFEKGQTLVGKEEIFQNHQYKSLEEIGQFFLKNRRVEKGCFAVAGPVRGGKCKMSNLPWLLDAAKIGHALHISEVYLLNDLEANAYGLKGLKKEDLFVLHQGIQQVGNQALISAGTGLGEAGLFWDGKEHRPFACEGGHTDFAPRNALEIELLLYLQKKFGHVSYERVVSGPGLHSLFQFLIDTGRHSCSPALKKEMEERAPSIVISEWGSRDRDAACAQALHWFLSLYGAEAGNVALKFLSLGGIYISGGIAPHLVKQIKEGNFYSSFIDKGRFKGVLESIPISIVLNENTPLLGAVYYATKKTGQENPGP